MALAWVFRVLSASHHQRLFRYNLGHVFLPCLLSCLEFCSSLSLSRRRVWPRAPNRPKSCRTRSRRATQSSGAASQSIRGVQVYGDGLGASGEDSVEESCTHASTSPSCIRVSSSSSSATTSAATVCARA
ncbi:hypothetical protein PR003_g12027 [Phytophthora rubi]|uniref:Uncharacterized protein n=1 Tax=Phytophthora rubi TaxID=129364 RepID=A0A6A4FA80_9STRA|nr:hypothetical protein PR003_g12027 [Phytophthora rubi]